MNGVIKDVYRYMFTGKKHNLFAIICCKEGLEFAVKYFHGNLYRDVVEVVEDNVSFFEHNCYTLKTASLIDIAWNKKMINVGKRL